MGHNIDTLIRFMELLHENCPWIFWFLLAVVCGFMTLLVLWAIVAQVIEKLRQQQIQGDDGNHRLSLWIRAGGLIALYVALIPVVLVVLVVVPVWEDIRPARQSF
jgi:hypothetical protein